MTLGGSSCGRRAELPGVGDAGGAAVLNTSTESRPGEARTDFLYPQLEPAKVTAVERKHECVRARPVLEFDHRIHRG